MHPCISGRVDQSCIYNTVYDCNFVDFPAKNTAHTLHICMVLDNLSETRCRSCTFALSMQCLTALPTWRSKLCFGVINPKQPFQICLLPRCFHDACASLSMATMLHKAEAVGQTFSHPYPFPWHTWHTHTHLQKTLHRSKSNAESGAVCLRTPGMHTCPLMKTLCGKSTKKTCAWSKRTTRWVWVPFNFIGLLKHPPNEPSPPWEVECCLRGWVLVPTKLCPPCGRHVAHPQK
jgi:hypothetical protein